MLQQHLQNMPLHHHTSHSNNSLAWLKAGLRNWLLKLVSCKNGSEFFNEVFCYKTQNITKHFQIIAAIWGKWSPEKHSAELSANVWLIYIKLWRMSEFPYQKCCKKNRQREKKSYICSHWHNFYVFDAVARWYLCGMFFFFLLAYSRTLCFMSHWKNYQSNFSKHVISLYSQALTFQPECVEFIDLISFRAVLSLYDCFYKSPTPWNAPVTSVSTAVAFIAWLRAKS